MAFIKTICTISKYINLLKNNMATNILPLKEQSIAEIYNGNKATYEVPIYQRNYAWEEDEITELIQDVYDAYLKNKKNFNFNNTYFIGTLVSYHKGDQVYEVIDGQQRLTTINLILSALDISVQNKLTYRARKKSDDTIKSIPLFKVEEKDNGIINGYNIAKIAINKIVLENKENFKNYFQNNVHLIHYNVPKDIDLNHYFEIMNSRGEQLEKHEIIKARLIEKLDEEDKVKFSQLWEYCSEMNIYIQQKYKSEEIFGKSLCDFKVSNFDELPEVEAKTGKKSIKDLINGKVSDNLQEKIDQLDTFQPIIDFSNFLLIVLKLTRIREPNFNATNFTLDDKELIREFDKIKGENNQVDKEFVKKFGFNLLKAKYLLDNYIVHHSNENDTIDSNPWKLQRWHKDGKNEYLKNLDEEGEHQHRLVQLLSMFEVSFTARQRKNYLFYCLMYLFDEDADIANISKYYQFINGLAEKYFKDVYLVQDNLNTINTPNPGSFDSTILFYNKLDIKLRNPKIDFNEIYGDGKKESKGIPLFVFNYLDYKLWEKYFVELRGEKTKEGSAERENFFKTLGCSDFGLELFKQFYFSRTRRSLEHFYPQAKADGKDGRPSQDQINCLGNYAMIGSEINSSGNNWDPNAKLSHYLDAGKIKQVSVASIKFMIMMQKCKENNMLEKNRKVGLEWTFVDIQEHQLKMVDILLK